MKSICLRLLLQTAILTAVFSETGHAQERAPATGGLQAKLEYCKTCHGLQGQGYMGYFPMPRLAGQQPDYIEAQLRAFIERRRTNPIMFNVAHVLSPSMLTALATHFRKSRSQAIRRSAKGTIVRGQNNLPRGASRSQRSCLLRLPWHGGQGPK